MLLYTAFLLLRFGDCSWRRQCKCKLTAPHSRNTKNLTSNCEKSAQFSRHWRCRDRQSTKISLKRGCCKMVGKELKVLCAALTKVKLVSAKFLRRKLLVCDNCGSWACGTRQGTVRTLSFGFFVDCSWDSFWQRCHVGCLLLLVILCTLRAIVLWYYFDLLGYLLGYFCSI